MTVHFVVYSLMYDCKNKLSIFWLLALKRIKTISLPHQPVHRLLCFPQPWVWQALVSLKRLVAAEALVVVMEAGVVERVS